MITRRKFLIGSGVVGGGLVLAMILKKDPPLPGLRQGSFSPNAYLQITPENDVVFHYDKAEMGQGIITGLTTLIAEELDIHPSKIITEAAGVHPGYGVPVVGQITGGSNSIKDSWQHIREAGASARIMLQQAAANHWSVDVSQVISSDGQLKNQASGEQLSYGECAQAAAQLDVPKSVELKDPEAYQYIGKFDQRLDARIKVNGKAEYGMDVDLPGMKIAMVKRCPHFGGHAVSFDAGEARAIPGVIDVLSISSGVAVLADSYWQASKAVKSLDVKWDKGELAGLTSAMILENQRSALRDGKMKELHARGDVQAASEDVEVVEAEYVLPFLHHSTMEPQNTTVLIENGAAEVWSPTQAPDLVQSAVHMASGIAKKKIKVNAMLMGGGFGRRAMTDFAHEAGEVAKAFPGTPVKLVWSREDDMQHDYYRPSSIHRMQGSLTDTNKLNTWSHTMVSSSVVTSFANMMMAGVLPSATPDSLVRSMGNGLSGIVSKAAPIMEEGTHIPYHCDNMSVSRTLYDPGIPTGFWRSVANSVNGYVTEGFMDEMAHKAGRDPVEFRLAQMQDFPRDKRVLELVAEKSNWGKSNTHQGVAVHPSFGSFVAMVAEVSVDGKSFTVDKVTVALDCGRVINPDIVVMQIEGAVIYGLSAALKPPLQIQDGAVAESNFHDLPVLRMHEAPEIEVHIVDSDIDPTGVGEIGTPPIAPAVANALFVASGQRLRELPLKLV